MNAKKIMGAVLVALLAAALLVGAGAAAEKGTYFAYQTGINTDLDGVWQKGADSVTIYQGNMSAVPVAGTYKKGDNTIYVTNPTATYGANGNLTGINYIVTNGGNVYKGSNLTIVVTSLNASVGADQIRIEKPNGLVSFEAPTFFDGNYIADVAGTYKVQAVWNAAGNFTVGAPLPVVDANVFTFTVVEPSDATISGAVDTVFAGDVISVTIKGTPGTDYLLNLTGFNISEQSKNQIVNLNVNGTGLNFTMPNIAEVTFQLKTDKDAKDEVKVELTTDADHSDVIGEVVIAVAKPDLTATLGATSYFIGDEIKLTLSSDIELDYKNYDFNITGTNFAETPLADNDEDNENNGKSFTVYLPTQGVNASGKFLDVGTYTIKVYQGTNNVVKTVTVALKQPFISIIDAPEVIVLGDDAEFVINAEAAQNVAAYVFGTNFFLPVAPQTADKDVKNQFTIKLAGETTANMSTGQYFAVFQHPMYDQKFNIMANGTSFYQNTSENAVVNNEANGYFLFSADARQTANAAQALCDALDSQNIDDMYVKASFFIVGEDESFSISEIPSTIAQGETLTISGVSTANAGNEVTVEMISTAFAAVPKETVGSAAFILVTTEVAEDGTWEVTLDTSDLNVDEYSLKVACGDDTWTNVKINVVEADEPVNPEQPEEPEQPEQPEEPVAPATPGFGALAALAGLGAVAVLLLRRE